jgi:alpha-tubulin suppressor-like RCC1 family protein
MQWSTGYQLACVHAVITAVWLIATVDASDVCAGIVMVDGGHYHTCAVWDDKTTRCWGFNAYGMLGDRTTDNSRVPVEVLGLSNVNSISASGSFHTCAVQVDGTALCWGLNANGQLGDGTQIDKNVSMVVSGVGNVGSISAGAYYTCAVLTDGNARCWGSNNKGQLGDGTTIPRNVPLAVSGLNNVRSISAGGEHTCAVLLNGSGCCWGNNNAGQLGDGTTNNSNVPVVVPNLSNVDSISVGGFHTCAVLKDGSARCWGFNNRGQLGDGTTTNNNVLHHFCWNLSHMRASI